MRYTDLEPTIIGITSPEGPFPVFETTIDGETRKVFGGLPDSLRDYYSNAASFGDQDCLVEAGRRISFTEVLQQVAALGQSLASRHGIRKGDRVAIAMRNSPEWCMSFMAITSLGAVAVPMNSWWQGEELAYGLEDSGAKLAILDGPRYQRIASWLTTSQLPVIGLDKEGAGLPDDVERLDELLLSTDPAAIPAVEIGPEDPAVVLYTSGSTGRARGVLSTQRNVLSSIGTWLVIGTALSIVDGTLGTEPEVQPAILLTVPLFHVTGLNSMFLFSLGIGRKIVMMYKWNIEKALELIEAERITHFNGVPTMSMELMNHPHLADYDLSCLVDIASGGAARPAEQVAKLIETFPGALPSAGYGLTESNAVGCLIGQQDYIDRPGSVGLPSPPLTEVRIVNDDGEQLPAGERGEICLRSPCVVSGYLNQPAASEAAFRRGWFHTGDVGYLDDDGFLHIVDRLKDIIIRGGENISCTEVEEALYAHPDIVEAAVFSLPDGRLGEIVGAAVSTSAGCDLDTASVQAFLADKLAAFKIPQQVWLQDEPLTRIASGKIFKKQIRAELIERLEFQRNQAAGRS